MRKITLGINSAAKDHINRYFDENNGEGSHYILGKITEIMTELNSLSVITDKKLRIKLTNLLLFEAQRSVENDSRLILEIKSHFINLIHTIRKIAIRRLNVTYIVFDSKTLKAASNKLYRNTELAERNRKRLTEAHKNDYTFDTLENYKTLKVKRLVKRYELENRETS